MNPEKRVVYNFYSSVGWSKKPDGSYVDSEAEDKRPVSAEYINRCHERLGRWLNGSGGYFLDCASGPVQYPQYLAYSRNYGKRVCVDFSFAALAEARATHKDHVLCVMADITKLAFRDSSFDAVLSMHTVYHVPESEQSQAFDELYRCTRPGRRCVVVYSLGDSSILNRLLRIPVRAFNLLTGRSSRFRELVGQVRRRFEQRATREPVAATISTPAGFYPHDWNWLTAHVLGQYDRPVVVPWRSLSVPAMRKLIHPQMLGRKILRLVYRLEDRFPHALARIGQYPTIVITKAASKGGIG